LIVISISVGVILAVAYLEVIARITPIFLEGSLTMF
jgi:hypothetical protein